MSCDNDIVKHIVEDASNNILTPQDTVHPVENTSTVEIALPPPPTALSLFGPLHNAEQILEQVAARHTVEAGNRSTNLAIPDGAEWAFFSPNHRAAAARILQRFWRAHQKVENTPSQCQSYKNKITTFVGDVFTSGMKDNMDTNNELENVYRELTSTKEQLLLALTEVNLYKKKERLINQIKLDNSIKKANNIPDIIIIVPYRDRASQRSAFMKIMPEILSDKNYEIYFAHQRDKRPFNRGAMKNLGFIYVKRKYGIKCKDITIVFHDIDSMPWHKNQFSYQTNPNVVNHFYGFEQALGGILAIKGIDFDKINGFPNIWTWGLEDNVLQMRCIKNNIQISRREFVDIHKNNKNIISLWHGWDRLISPNIEPKWRYDSGRDGIRTLSNISMSSRPLNDNVIEINISSFETGEPLTSPFVRNARMRNARQHSRQNEPIIPPRPIKRGSARSFGRGRGLRRMLMHT
jgi:hypothetical protein